VTRPRGHTPRHWVPSHFVCIVAFNSSEPHHGDVSRRVLSNSRRMGVGVQAGNARQSGSRWRIAAMRSDDVPPANGVRPGERLVQHAAEGPDVGVLLQRWPRACSGLMYAAVPSSRPSRVPPTVTVGEVETRARPTPCATVVLTVARPKS